MDPLGTFVKSTHQNDKWAVEYSDSCRRKGFPKWLSLALWEEKRFWPRVLCGAVSTVVRGCSLVVCQGRGSLLVTMPSNIYLGVV